MSTTPETTVQRTTIVDLIIMSAQDVMAMNGVDAEQPKIGEETRLIGHEAILDSLGLVSLVVEVEQHLADDLEVTLILADERAMSQKRSPFRSIGALADYVCELVTEQGIHVER
jgi:acyl carrier protein